MIDDVRCPYCNVPIEEKCGHEKPSGVALNKKMMAKIRKQLEPFDALRKCPKCGHDKISSYYHPAGEMGGYDSPGWNSWEIKDQERIDRNCLRCSYAWAEAVLS